MSDSDDDENVSLLQTGGPSSAKSNKSNSSSTTSSGNNSPSTSPTTSRSGTQSVAININNQPQDTTPLILNSKRVSKQYPWWVKYIPCSPAKFHPPMTPEDKLKLSWFEKWKRFGRFPWKLVLHTLVTIFTTVLVILR
jgi:hypothetical protein